MLLRAIDLVVRHNPALAPTLSRVGLSVASGEVVAVVGSNGSGKSTLARALAGLVELESGTISGANGGPVRVGLVLQDPAAQLVAITVADEVATGPEAAGLAPAHVASLVDVHIGMQQLDALRDRDPAGLSGGQQQRVAIAAIGACVVDVLVLDEPTALLDPLARRAFAASVRELAAGRGVVWITQVPDDVALCDRVVVLDAGTVVWAGDVRDYVARPEVASSFGLELPAAARIAHELATSGGWPEACAVPLTVDELVDQLVGGPARG